MKRTDGAALLGCVALAIVACGGNVVVDTGSAGSTGGSGSTGAGFVCGDITGEGFQGGGCQTDATCSGHAIVVLCMPVQTGASCSCSSDGNTVGTCQETSSSQCSPTAGCCATFFGG